MVTSIGQRCFSQGSTLVSLTPLLSLAQMLSLGVALCPLACVSVNDDSLFSTRAVVMSNGSSAVPVMAGDPLPPVPVGEVLPPIGNPAASSESDVGLPLGVAPNGLGPGGLAPVGQAPMSNGGADAEPEMAPDAGSVGVAPVCRPGAFQAPERILGLDPDLDLWAPALSADALTLYLAASEDGGAEHIFVATRSDRGNSFSSIRPLAGVNSDAAEGTPFPSSDGLTLYFYSTRAGGLGDRDLWSATRRDTAAEFGNSSLLANVNSASLDHLPWLSADELTLVFVSTRLGGQGQSDVWGASRASRAEDFEIFGALTSINTIEDEGRAVLSSDLLTLIYASTQPGGAGRQDLWMSTRADLADAFSAVSATNLTQVNGPGLDLDPFLSGDERELFFSSDRDARNEIWRSVRACE